MDWQRNGHMGWHSGFFQQCYRYGREILWAGRGLSNTHSYSNCHGELQPDGNADRNINYNSQRHTYGNCDGNFYTYGDTYIDAENFSYTEAASDACASANPVRWLLGTLTMSIQASIE